MTWCVLTVCVFDSLFKSRSKYFYDDDRVLVLTLLISIEAILFYSLSYPCCNLSHCTKSLLCWVYRHHSLEKGHRHSIIPRVKVWSYRRYQIQGYDGLNKMEKPWHHTIVQSHENFRTNWLLDEVTVRNDIRANWLGFVRLSENNLLLVITYTTLPSYSKLYQHRNYSNPKHRVPSSHLTK